MEEEFTQSEQALVLELFRTEGFIVLNKIAIKTLGLIPAVVLGSYVERYLYFLRNHPENNGWFFSIHEQMIEELNIGISIIRKAKNELLERGIIKTELRGVPAKEWITINVGPLTLAVLKLNGKGSDSWIPINNNKYKKDNILVDTKVPTREREGKTSLKERNKEYIPMVSYLSSIIQTNKNIKHTTQQLYAWANEFRRLEENQGVSRQRIKSALRWYSSNIGRQYTPVIESGAAFCKKFTNLEYAMKQDSQPRRTPSKPPIYDDGIRYVWNEEKQYYVHGVSGERYIP